MSTQSVLSKIVQAAQSKSVYKAALAYQEIGFSVLPLKGKRPAIRSWADRQHHAATALNIEVWHQAHHLQNVGIVCGEVSQNLVVLDLDGAAGYPAFAAQFPGLAETYTVATGGGTGKHVYWRVDELPETVKAMGTPIGHLELCANGRQVVAPPSIHPDTQRQYVVEKSFDILQVPDLNDLVTWIESFKPKVIDQSFRPAHHNPNGDVVINPNVIRAIESHFISQGFKQLRDWLHGPCIYPHRHKNGDKNPSFGFNLTSGYAYCYVCGTILAKDVCEVLGIDPNIHGGLVEKPEHHPLDLPAVTLSNAPKASNTSPPEVTDSLPDVSTLKLPDWLQMYLDWAGTTGNQTPMSFHLGAGLWLLSVAVGRRLYAEAPWGVKIFPNLYLMMIASTTYYRKSTAYKLAEQVARQAIPHMLMPTPGSPERFQEGLSGRLPANFDKLTTDQQSLLKRAQPFAAQRGLFKDEVAGLFGAINRKEY